MDVRINVTGEKELERMFSSYAEAVLDALYTKYLKWAHKLAGIAARLAPAQTGTLKASIHGEVTRSGTEIIGAYGTNVKHGAYVEFGTNRIKVGTPESPKTDWPAKRATGTTSPESMPYMRTAWARNRNAFISDLENIGGEVKVK